MTRRARAAAALAALAAALLATGCGIAQDRPNPQPDEWADATNVTLWRNADGIPNVATFCLGDLAFAATLSGSHNESPALLRLDERDPDCGRSAQ